MRILSRRNGQQSMNDATFADWRGMWSATFLPTSYCQLNITYRCKEISIDIKILRRRRYHHSSWKKIRDRLSRSFEKKGRKKEKKKRRRKFFYNSTRNKYKRRVKKRYESTPCCGGSDYFSFPTPSLPPPAPSFESISSALRWPHVRFISDQFHHSRQNKSTLV